MTLLEKFSNENIKKEIISRIETEFGKEHGVKIALFKAISEYNDEVNNYDPILILIGKDYNEIEHKIRLNGLYPTQDEQYNAYEELNDLLYVNDVTINF